MKNLFSRFSKDGLVGPGKASTDYFPQPMGGHVHSPEARTARALERIATAIENRDGYVPAQIAIDLIDAVNRARHILADGARKRIGEAAFTHNLGKIDAAVARAEVAVMPAIVARNRHNSETAERLDREVTP